MNEQLLETVEHVAGGTPTASVLWLHGLGADGHDFEPIVPELDVGTGLRFVFPHAPVRPVTINAGMQMRAWFDIVGLERGTEQDEPGIRAAEKRIEALIRRENERGVPSERILLAGFSQGGALALHTGLRYPERLAGLVGLSTFLPLDWTLDAEAHEANRKTPVFMAHGALDPMVPAVLGGRSRDFLVERGYAVEWKAYNMLHAVCAQEIRDLRNWMEPRLTPR